MVNMTVANNDCRDFLLGSNVGESILLSSSTGTV